MTDEQVKLMTALLGNQDVSAACQAAGISRATAYRWMKEPDFQEELRRARDEVLSEALATVKTHAAKAVARLAALVDAQDDRVSRHACNDILSHALKVRELDDFERQDQGGGKSCVRCRPAVPIVVCNPAAHAHRRSCFRRRRCRGRDSFRRRHLEHCGAAPR